MDLEAVHDVLDLYLWLRYQIFPLCASFFQVIGQIKSFSDGLLHFQIRHILARCFIVHLGS